LYDYIDQEGNFHPLQPPNSIGGNDKCRCCDARGEAGGMTLPMETDIARRRWRHLEIYCMHMRVVGRAGAIRHLTAWSGVTCMAPPDRREVYVTGIGRVLYCKRCSCPVAECRCKEQQAQASARPGLRQDGWVRLARETQGRRGKAVTLIAGLPQ